MKLETQILMGNSDASLNRIGHLYQLLSKAITLIDLMQQPGYREPETEEEEILFMEQHDRYQEQLQSIADEIYLGLTGLVPTKFKLSLGQGKSNGT